MYLCGHYKWEIPPFIVLEINEVSTRAVSLDCNGIFSHEKSSFARKYERGDRGRREIDDKQAWGKMSLG